MATARQTIPAGDPSSPATSAQGALIPAKGAQSSPPTGERSIGERFEALLRQAQANRPNEDISLIRKAWEFCVSHHKGQTRASGEPYIVHPFEVAEVLVEMKLDATAVAMCRENRLPMIVFNLNVPGNIMRISMGEPVGTLIH